MSRIGRVHKRFPLVRRNIPLSLGLRRGFDALLDAPSIATFASWPWSFGCSHDPRGHLPRYLANLSATDQSLDISAPIEEHILGDGDNRGKGSDLLTQRQFCAIRRGRPRYHRVTIAIILRLRLLRHPFDVNAFVIVGQAFEESSFGTAYTPFFLSSVRLFELPRRGVTRRTLSPLLYD